MSLNVNQPNRSLKPVSNRINGKPAASDTCAEQTAEAALVAEALAGDTSAFDQLVERHHSRAVSVAYRLVGNVHDAWEVAQEAFLRAHRSLARLRNRNRFEPWLLRIVTNLALNFRRSRRSEPRVSLNHERGRPSGGSAAPEGAVRVILEAPGDELIAAETREALAAAINSLPEKQQLAITLFAVEGLPQAQVAEIIGCSVELVKWNVFQARKRLRELLQDRI